MVRFGLRFSVGFGGLFFLFWFGVLLLLLFCLGGGWFCFIFLRENVFIRPTELAKVKEVLAHVFINIYIYIYICIHMYNTHMHT